MQCFLPQNQTTPEKTLSNPWFGKGFCEPGQYKAAIDRCEGGYKSCELGIEITRDLVKIFENHSEAIRHWSTSSQKKICQSQEFGTTKKAWVDSIRAVEKLAERHDNITENIQKLVIEKMTSYKSENYGRSIIHVRKIKEFKDEFKKAQQSWLELIGKINDAKQTFHDAKRKLQNAEGAEKVIETDVGSSDEHKQKVKLSVASRRKETERCKTKYQNLIDEMDEKKEAYEKKMFDILERTDEFERKRLNHFKSMLNALQKATSLDEDKCHAEMATAFKTAISDHKIEEDIAFFNKNYGKDTKTTYPVFEDLKD